MPFTEITYKVADRIATVTLNRPAKLNAWTPTMEQEVRQAMGLAESDDGVGVVVLTGAGRSFCAGMDVGFLGDLLTCSNPGERIEQLRKEFTRDRSRDGARPDFQTVYSYFPALNKPIIAALNGPTVGLGLVIALYCDIRVASASAKFTTAFAQRGLIAEHGLAWMLSRLVGIANACDLLFSARTIDAAEALRLGLINRVLPEDGFLTGVMEYAQNLATRVSPRSLRIMKKQIYDAQFQSLREAIDAANVEMFESLLCEDFREGVAHFLEKRPARFTGK